jgi:DNA-binding IclR family transcriptional regulator
MDSLPDAQTSVSRTTGVGVLDRCVALLDLLADGPKTLRSLSAASRLPRPTAHRLLVALEAHRLVARDASGAFRLGPRLTELAAVAGPELDLASLAGPVLDELHRTTRESVQLYVRSGDHRLCIAARDSGTGLRDSVPVGALLPLAAGSGGKVLLTWSGTPSGGLRASAVRGAPGEPSGVRGVPGEHGVPPGQHGDSELAWVRDQGWAASVAEREPGVASVSAPVFRAATLLAALCVSGPVSRLGETPGRGLSQAVVAAAAELSALLHEPASQPERADLPGV